MEENQTQNKHVEAAKKKLKGYRKGLITMCLLVFAIGTTAGICLALVGVGVTVLTTMAVTVVGLVVNLWLILDCKNLASSAANTLSMPRANRHYWALGAMAFLYAADLAVTAAMPPEYLPFWPGSRRRMRARSFQGGEVAVPNSVFAMVVSQGLLILCYFISACYVASAVKKVKLAAEETGRDGLAMDEASTSSDGVNQAPVKSVPEAVIR